MLLIISLDIFKWKKMESWKFETEKNGILKN